MSLFTCSKCGAGHSRIVSRGPAKGVRAASYCSNCHAAFMRATRPVYGELTQEERRKSNARSYANTYQRRGKIAPKPCEKCGCSTGRKASSGLLQAIERAVVVPQVPFGPAQFVEHSGGGMRTMKFYRERPDGRLELQRVKLWDGGSGAMHAIWWGQRATRPTRAQAVTLGARHGWKPRGCWPAARRKAAVDLARPAGPRGRHG